MNRLFGPNGAPLGITDAQAVNSGGIFRIENSQTVFYKGNGDKYWFIDTTAGAVTVPLPGATTDAALSVTFTVKRLTAGANACTITTDGGNIDGSVTYSLPTQYNVVRIVSNGTDYYTV